MLFVSCRDFQLTCTVSRFSVSIFSLIKPPVTNRKTVSCALLRGSSQARGQTQVSRVADGFFTV